MKEGWTYKKLGEIADIVHGKNQKEVLSENGRYPIYGSGGNIIGYANDYLCEAGTTILGRKGSINNPQFIEERFWNVDTAFGISAKEGYDSKFIYYFITSIDWLKKNTGTTLPSLTQQVVKSVEMPVPPLDEQQRIVERLDSAFENIDKLKANAEKQLAEARTLFQKGLAKAMEPKEGWEDKKLRDISQIKGGKRVPQGYKLETEKTNYPYIRVADFTDDGTIDLSDIHYINKSVYQQIKNYTITDKDIYISIAGTIGKSGIIPSCLNGANLTENACKLVLNDGLEQRYVYWFTKSNIFKDQISSATRQASQPKLALTRLAEVCITLPPLAVQQRIVERLDSLSENVRKYEEIQRQIISECDALKQALLRKVFE